MFPNFVRFGSGGCLPVEAPVMIGTSRMNQILHIDLLNRYVIAQAGVVNLWVSNAVKSQGFQYAPDPSSQQACTIGGNVAENSGGPHTLKYGVTTNHVLGVELVLPDGEVIQLGGVVEDVPGYDLRGITIGAEGTFGIVTQAMLRLTRQPQAYRTFLAVFETVPQATQTVSDIIAAGIVPAALEMMDNLMIQAVEAAFRFGFPTDAGAVLIIELDGLVAGLDPQTKRIMELCNRTRRVRCVLREMKPSAQRYGRAGNAPSARLVVSHQTIARRMVWSLAPRCRISWRRLLALPKNIGCVSGTFSTPEMAISIRFCCSTNATRMRPGGC